MGPTFQEKNLLLKEKIGTNRKVRIADSGSLYLFALKLFITSILAVADLLPYRVLITQKEITSQTDKHLVILSSKTYGFEDKLTKY